MKATQFSIVINLKTTTGYESVGKFFIGNKRKFAKTLFQQLKGNTDVDEKTMLTMELLERVNELPLNIKIISCSLENLAENCQTITKEIFKAINLEEL